MWRLDRKQLRIYLFVFESEPGKFDAPMTVVDYMPTATTTMCDDLVNAESQLFRALRQLYRELKGGDNMAKKGEPKRDGSDGGTGKNKGRGGCKPIRKTRKGRNRK